MHLTRIWVGIYMVYGVYGILKYGDLPDMETELKLRSRSPSLCPAKPLGFQRLHRKDSGSSFLEWEHKSWSSI